MKRSRSKSFIHDPRAPSFMAVFGFFFLWAAYNTLKIQKITPGRILYSVLLAVVAFCSIAPVIVQLAVALKRRKATAVEETKEK